jgi:SAM-dependent methyltransferase
LSDSGIYRKEPLEYHGSVPVFSKKDLYIENYEKISCDHLSSMTDGQDNPWIEEEIWNEIEDATSLLIKKYSSPSDRILDVGVGLGRLLSRFTGLERYGMDISRGYLDVAHSKGINVCCSKVEDMPYREDFFDIVVCTDVLEHVVNLTDAVSNLLSVTKTGGYIIIRVPYREDLSQYLDKNYPYYISHVRAFDEFSLRILFERLNNCEYIEEGYVAYMPSLFKLKYKLPAFNFVVFRLLRIIRVVSKKMFLNACRFLFEPTEINVVFRKS